MVKNQYFGHFIINDGSKVDVNVPQLMHIVRFVIIIHFFFVILNQRTRLKKGLMFYFKNNDITTFEEICGCRPWINCKNIQGRNEQQHEKFNGKITYQKKAYNKWECYF